jgi:hypothetical protein
MKQLLNELSTEGKNAYVAQELIHKMDWELLKAQKKVLINLQSKKSITPAEWSALEGIINGIDAEQDIATDVFGIEEETVFNLGDKLTMKEAKEKCING